MVDEFQATVESRFHDGHLPFVHQSYDVVGVVHLLHELSFVRGTPAVDGDEFARLVPSRRAVEQRAGKSEAVAIIGAHHAAVGAGFLAHDEVGAGHGRTDA